MARRCSLALLVVVLAVGGTACGDDGGGGGRDVASGANDDVEASFQESFDLPFGLEQVEGTEPIGRPAVYEGALYWSDGELVTGPRLQAAYWVTAEDPPAVLRAWADQLDHLAFDEVRIGEGAGGPGAWMQVTGYTDDPGGDYAELQLWATDAAPILLVSISRKGDDPPRDSTVDDEAGDRPAPRSAVEVTERSAGDVLFTEQGSDMHLPEGTRALMPTIPIFAGTGGSSSVLAAEDGEAAVQALLDEGMGHSDYGEVTGPEVTEADGAEVVTGSFVIPAGGWAFDAVSVRAPGDPYATLYITSSAD